MAIVRVLTIHPNVRFIFKTDSSPCRLPPCSITAGNGKIAASNAHHIRQETQYCHGTLQLSQAASNHENSCVMWSKDMIV